MSLRHTLIIVIASLFLLFGCSDDSDNGKNTPDSQVASDTGGTNPDSNTNGDMPSISKDGSQPQDDGKAPPKDGGTKKDTGPSGCGKIPLTIGCCDGEVLKWCEEDGKGGYVVQTYDCTKNKLPKCGWSGFTTQAYACATNGDPDPSGKHPKACPP
jgi:hypothetical protein